MQRYSIIHHQRLMALNRPLCAVAGTRRFFYLSRVTPAEHYKLSDCFFSCFNSGYADRRTVLLVAMIAVFSDDESF